MGFLKGKTRTRPEELRHFEVTTGVRIDVYPAPEVPVAVIVEDTLVDHEVVSETVVEQTMVEETTEAVMTEPVDRTKNALAALAYLNVLFLVPLFMRERDEFVTAHLRQGIALFALTVACSFTAWFSVRVWAVTAAAFAVASVLLAMRAWQGKTSRLPLIGGVAEKLAV